MTGLILGIVPARAGSKGVPGKNISLLAGRPLLDYTVRAAHESGVIDRLILSTDSEEIADIGRTCGLEVPFLRPADLAADDSPMLSVVEHALKTLERSGWHPQVIIVLQPTSPLRRPDHISDAVRLLRDTNADSVASVIELPLHMSPDYVMKINEGHLKPFLAHGSKITRRQDARLAYVRDGTVYAFWRRTIVEQHSLYGQDCKPLVLPSSESITIDTFEDLAEAERRLASATTCP